MGYVCLNCGNAKKFKVFYRATCAVRQRVVGSRIEITDEDYNYDEEIISIMCGECGSTNCIQVEDIYEEEGTIRQFLDWDDEEFNEFMNKFLSKNASKKINMKEKVGE